MSRTYRLRNLPRLTARKYVDGNGGWNYKRRDARLLGLRERYYPEYGTGHRWSNPYYSIVYDIERQLERQFPSPVEPAYGHPWVSWCRIGNVKAWYKRRGNRNARRRTRLYLRTTSLDETFDDDGRRKAPTRRQEVWDVWNIC